MNTASGTTIVMHLGPELAHVVEAAILSGEFVSPEDVVAAALGDWQINRLLLGVAADEAEPVAAAVIELGASLDGEAQFDEIDLESYLASRTR